MAVAEISDLSVLSAADPADKVPVRHVGTGEDMAATPPALMAGMPVATTGAKGLLSATDKTVIDGVTPLFDAADSYKIKTGSIKAGAIVAADLASNAVTTAKITDANVITAKLADNAVTTVKITDANVTTAKIADSNVTTAKIADNAVTTPKIPDGAVTTAKIAAGAVLKANVGAGVVTADTNGYIDNAQVNNTVYEHGTAAANNGNQTYYYSGRGLGLYANYGTQKTFSVIKFKGWAASNSVVRVRVYKNTGLWNRDNIDSMTMVQEYNYAAGAFNTVADSFHTLVLSTPLTLLGTEYLYVLFASSAGTSVSLRYWDSVAYSGLFPFLKKLNQANAWLANDSWNAGSATTEIGVPFKLYNGFAYLGDVNTLSDSTTTALAGKAAANSSTGLISGAYVENLTYQHPNGLAEYVGNDDYSNTNRSLGMYYQAAGGEIVRYIRLALYGDTTTAAVVKVYRATSSIAGSTVSGATLVKSFTFAAGGFNTDKTKLLELALDAPIKLAANEYLYVLAQKTAGTDITVRYWTSAGSPTRLRFLSNTSDPWGAGTWALSTSSYYATPLWLAIGMVNYTELAAKADYQDPMLAIPAVVAVAVGRQCNLYNDALINTVDKHHVRLSTTSVTRKERCHRYAPAGTGSVSTAIEVIDQNNTVLQKKQVTLQAVADNAGTGTKQFLIFGDSFIDRNDITKELKDLLVAGGGITPVFLGQRGTSGYQDEGYGGWKTDSFSTIGRSGWNFTGLPSHTIAVDAVYSNNGSQFTVTEVYTNRVVCERTSGSNAPSASGTLTKVSGTGGATVTYTAVAGVSLNPFWDDGGAALSYAAWMTEQGYAGNIDFCVISLGVNDTNYNYTQTAAQTAAIVANMVVMAATMIAEYPSCKIIFCMPAICARSQDNLTNDRWTYEYNMRKLWQAMIAQFDAGAYHANVSLAACGLWTDRQYGYDTTTEAVSSRVATTVTVYTDTLHPNVAGFKQSADAIYSEVRRLLS